MPFFDFHVHVALKPQFNKVENRDSPWTQLSFGLDAMDVIDSQSCLSQLAKGHVNFVGIALHAPEANMAKGLSKILQNETFFFKVAKCLARAAFTRIIEKVDNARLSEIASGKSYYTVFLQEVNNIMTHLTSPGGQHTIKLLDKATDYNELDSSTIHAFFVVEGIHCFFGDQDINTPQGWQQFQDNITAFTSTHKVVSINLAHLQYNQVVNHCFGIKIFDGDGFFPEGNGIMPPKERVEGLIKQLNDKGILIDVKHMSHASRKAYYAYNWKREGGPMPIVCTHVGVTGIPISKAEQYMRKPKKKGNVWEVEHFKKLGIVPRTSFNLSSINLYDEDIIEIVQSKGLIGISFDRRIIGYTEYYQSDIITDTEYLSPGELQSIVGSNPVYTGWNDVEVFTDTTLDIDDLRNSALLDLRYFFNQLFHIINIGGGADRDLRIAAAKCICLGSDFDGMIDSFDCCKDASRMNDFYLLAKKHYTDIAADADFDTDGLADLIEWVFLKSGRSFVLNRIGLVNN